MTTTEIIRNIPDTNWYEGHVNGLHVQALAFAEPSHYGMAEEGRISKLWVRINEAIPFDFDRGEFGADYLDPDSLAMVVRAVVAALDEPADDGERRCEECGESFNIEETGEQDVCLKCEFYPLNPHAPE